MHMTTNSSTHNTPDSRDFEQLLEEGRRKGYVRRSDLQRVLLRSGSPAQPAGTQAKGTARKTSPTPPDVADEHLTPDLTPDLMPESDSESDEPELDLDADSAVD